MGTWGAGIFSDDLAADMRSDFRRMVGAGLTGREATERLLREYASTIDDPDEGPPFWIALAAVQSRLGRLDKEVRRRALAVIDDGSDLRRWADHPRSQRARRAVLAKLRDELTGPPIPEAAIRLPKPWISGLRTGDTFAYRLDDGRYCVLRVLGISGKHGDECPTCEVLDWLDIEPPASDAARSLPIRLRPHPQHRWGQPDFVGPFSPLPCLVLIVGSDRNYRRRMVLLDRAAPGAPDPHAAPGPRPAEQSVTWKRLGSAIPWISFGEPSPYPMSRERS